MGSKGEVLDSDFDKLEIGLGEAEQNTHPRDRLVLRSRRTAILTNSALIQREYQTRCNTEAAKILKEEKKNRRAAEKIRRSSLTIEQRKTEDREKAKAIRDAKKMNAARALSASVVGPREVI